VQQAIAGAQYYDCAAAAVVTQSTFTRAAKRQARRADPPVLLVDRSRLSRMADLLAGLVASNKLSQR
jgi:HJR/Mrr/RecB family endonuclease